MKSISSVIISLTVVTLAAATGWAHGVEGSIEKAEGVCVTALYDDGEPMNYAAVEIKAPGSETVFQSGRTDRNGRFLFKPDGQGQWDAVVTDGMGHRLALTHSIGGGKAAQVSVETGLPAASAGTSRPLKALAGLSIIFGLCGFLYGWKARRQFGETKTSRP
jgi:nickel transport protein